LVRKRMTWFTEKHLLDRVLGVRKGLWCGWGNRLIRRLRKNCMESDPPGEEDTQKKRTGGGEGDDYNGGNLTSPRKRGGGWNHKVEPAAVFLFVDLGIGRRNLKIKVWSRSKTTAKCWGTGLTIHLGRKTQPLLKGEIK